MLTYNNSTFISMATIMMTMIMIAVIANIKMIVIMMSKMMMTDDG